MRSGVRISWVLVALAAAGCGGRTALNPVRLTSGAGDKFSPAFSADGQSIVYAKRLSDNETHLFAIQIAGGAERQLTFGPCADGEPACSHDGTRVAFESDRDGSRQVYVVAADMGEAKGCPRAVALTGPPGASGAPSWSPDDARIAFESDRSGNIDIWVMDADGDNAVALTRGPTPDTAPAWSPDGAGIAFSSERTGNRDVWMMDPDGSLPRRLTTDEAQEWRPRWTPDSRQLIFMWSGKRGEVEFYEVRRTGQGARQVVATSDSIRDPVVSPDGKWLAFSANHEGAYDIYLLKLGD